MKENGRKQREGDHLAESVFMCYIFFELWKTGEVGEEEKYKEKALERLSVNIPTEEWKSFFALELNLQRLF